MQRSAESRSIHNSRLADIPFTNHPRSTFDLSRSLKTTFNASELIPTFIQECYPGDTITCKVNTFARFATLQKPIMDSIDIKHYYFIVPLRLLWENFQNFMGENLNDSPVTDYLIPTINTTDTQFDTFSLYDYLGLPVGVPNLQDISALPLRACNLIWNDYFRDQNLQSKEDFRTDDGPDPAGIYTRLLVNKVKDYFTSALPWPQKIEPVPIPLSGRAPVYSVSPTANNSGNLFQTWNTDFNSGSSPLRTGMLQAQPNATASNRNLVGTNLSETALTGVSLSLASESQYTGDYYPPYADLALAEGVLATINDFRTANMLQEFMERDARGGTRYTEINYSHFGVQSSDARLQRPEYLGGGVTHLSVNTIAQTVPTDDSGMANLAAFGTTSGQFFFSDNVEEHSLILGFAACKTEQSYQQRVERFWTRQTKFDFYWPTFAHLGEQAILNREIRAVGTSADLNVFGYQERWSELRSAQNQITGGMRSDPTSGGSYDIWHIAQDWPSAPSLNSAFIVDNPPFSRIVDVPTEAHFLLDMYFDVEATRALPAFSIPQLSSIL